MFENWSLVLSEHYCLTWLVSMKMRVGLLICLVALTNLLAQVLPIEAPIVEVFEPVVIESMMEPTMLLQKL